MSTTPAGNCNPISSEQAHWYVVKTKQNAEKRVHERLEASGFTSFLPLCVTLRQWSDRKKKVKTPLIPSHLFVYCVQQELARIYSIPGICSVLSEWGKPAVVREHEINNLRKLCALQLEPACVALEPIPKGSEVTVSSGPFAGFTGVVTKNSKGMHVHLVFKDLGLALVLNNTQIHPLSDQ